MNLPLHLQGLASNIISMDKSFHERIHLRNARFFGTQSGQTAWRIAKERGKERREGGKEDRGKEGEKERKREGERKRGREAGPPT